MSKILKFKKDLTLTLDESSVLEDIIQSEIVKLQEYIVETMVELEDSKISKKEKHSKIKWFKEHIQFVKNLKKKLFENSEIVDI